MDSTHENPVFPFMQPFSHHTPIDAGKAYTTFTVLAEEYFQPFNFGDKELGIITFEAPPKDTEPYWYALNIIKGGAAALVLDTLGIQPPDNKLEKEAIRVRLYAYYRNSDEFVSDVDYYTDSLFVKRFDDPSLFFENMSASEVETEFKIIDGTIIALVDGQEVKPQRMLDVLNKKIKDSDEKVDLEQAMGIQKQPVGLSEIMALKKFIDRCGFEYVCGP